MTKIDVYSGFLGAGKTTLIKKMIKEAYVNEKLVLIENEFGDIGIDGAFMQDAGIEITEMNSGCICCSLVGDFGKALEKVLHELHPDRILIEPSGVGKLSDVLRAIQNIGSEDAALNACVTVVDAAKCRMYMRNFGEFFKDQVEHAGCIVLSHTGNMSAQKVDAAVQLLREVNHDAVMMTTDWDSLTGDAILSAMEKKDTLQMALDALKQESAHHHHHHHAHDEECDCHHDHEHHHEHGEECDCHHEHHHEHDEHCTCGCHGHEHHHADDVFTSWGIETAAQYTKEKIEDILNEFAESSDYGTILRSKGILPATDGTWIHFDYVPGEADVRTGTASVTGRICVIGADLKKDMLAKIFEV